MFPNVRKLHTPNAPKPMNFVGSGQALGSGNSTQTTSVPPAATGKQIPGEAFEASTTTPQGSQASTVGRPSVKHKGNNVKSNILSEGHQKFKKGLIFGRASKPSNEQKDNPRSKPLPPPPGAEHPNKAKPLQTPATHSNRSYDREHIGDNFMSNVVNGGTQEFDGGLEFLD